MSEARTQQLLRLDLSAAGAVMFRNNRGVAWMGDATRLADGSVLIRNARRVEFGLTDGASDLIGWTPTVIGGRRVAVFTAVEVKSERGRATPAQQQFIAAVQAAGGFAGIARTAADGRTIIDPARMQANL